MQINSGDLHWSFIWLWLLTASGGFVSHKWSPPLFFSSSLNEGLRTKHQSNRVPSLQRLLTDTRRDIYNSENCSLLLARLSSASETFDLLPPSYPRLSSRRQFAQASSGSTALNRAILAFIGLIASTICQNWSADYLYERTLSHPLLKNWHICQMCTQISGRDPEAVRGRTTQCWLSYLPVSLYWYM